MLFLIGGLLLYCVGFCHTSTQISLHIYTYIPSLLNLPPTSNPIPLCFVTFQVILTPVEIWELLFLTYSASMRQRLNKTYVLTVNVQRVTAGGSV